MVSFRVSMLIPKDLKVLRALLLGLSNLRPLPVNIMLIINWPILAYVFSLTRLI